LSRAFAIESWQINAKGSSVSTRRFPLAEVLRVAEFLEATLLNDFHRNVIAWMTQSQFTASDAGAISGTEHDVCSPAIPDSAQAVKSSFSLKNM
jgi:hypothetical protein